MVVVGGRENSERPDPLLPWWAAAGIGGVLSAAVMWVLVCGAFALGWIAAPDLSSSAVFTGGTRAWLLTYFAGAHLAGLNITIPPLGLTMLALVVGAGIAAFATSQARLAAPEELTGRQRRALALRVMYLFTLAHALTVLVPSFVVATAEQSARALVGAIAIGALASGVGAIRTAQWHVTAEWPEWARTIPAAVAVGLLVMQVTGALVVTLALVTHRDQVIALHESLQPDPLGSVLLLVLQLLWLPNVVIWGSSWALGAGFQLGSGSMVTPAQTEIAMLPAIPILGAVPDAGRGSQLALWWLASGLVAGAACALVVLRRRPRARFDETALVGGLTAVLAGLIVVGLGLLASGDIGTGRLIGIGVRPTPLFVMAPTLLGIAGVTTGAVWGLLRPMPKQGQEDIADPDPDPAEGDRLAR